MTAHTPGPWRVESDTDGPFVVMPALQGDERADDEALMVYAATSENAEQREADAYLIAAAPELYDHAETALEILIDTLGPCDPGCDCIIHPLTDALAKARGES